MHVEHKQNCETGCVNVLTLAIDWHKFVKLKFYYKVFVPL